MHFEVDVSRVVPFLSSPPPDAILDSVACASDDCKRFLIDVTVRTPHARKCGSAAAIRGAAALNGEADKLRRYDEHVKGLPVEKCWGDRA